MKYLVSKVHSWFCATALFASWSQLCLNRIVMNEIRRRWEKHQKGTYTHKFRQYEVKRSLASYKSCAFSQKICNNQNRKLTKGLLLSVRSCIINHNLQKLHDIFTKVFNLWKNRQVLEVLCCKIIFANAKYYFTRFPSYDMTSIKRSSIINQSKKLRKRLPF